MPPAAGVMSQQSDRFPVKQIVAPPPQPVMLAAAPPQPSEAFAKDAIIAWFRGEFAAANAIIDALCGHLRQMDNCGAGEYDAVFAAVHRRRMNWIPILQMQKYFSIADVTLELQKVSESLKPKKRAEEDIPVDAEEKRENIPVVENGEEEMAEKGGFEAEVDREKVVESEENGGGVVVDDDLPESDVTDTGSQEVQPLLEHFSICLNHEECETRRDHIKMTKGFVAKESVKGHTVNVVRGLKLYDDIFTDVELSKLNDFVNELRVAGQNGDLSGETFILYNQQVKGNKRELIQLGVPIFGQIKEDAKDKMQSYIEPIPALLEGVIDHLIQWHLIPENRKPNSCIINYFDEGEYSQPFLKPPHLDQPVSTLLLSESKMAFGRSLFSDSEGNYRGPLMLSLKKGSLLVMRGNSSETARHVMCSSTNKRVTVTFFRVRIEPENNLSEITPLSGAMTLWQPGVQDPYPVPNGTTLGGYNPMDMIPKWGVLRAPLVMLAPMRPMITSPRRVPRGGTGVFLPWTVGSRKPARHLPPRAQKGRFLALPPPVESPRAETTSDPGIKT